MTTDQQQAEAVVDGLAEVFRCDCGKEHPHGPHPTSRVTYYRQNPMELKSVECACGRWHHGLRVYCDCGSEWTWGPRTGWKIAFRKHARWKEREAEFRARIKELEESLHRAIAWGQRLNERGMQ